MRFWPTLFAVLATFSLHAAYEDTIESEEAIPPPEVKGKPFSIETFYDYIGFSKMTKKEFDCTKIRFSAFNILGDAVVWYKTCHKEGFIVEGGYTNNQIVWPHNPFFNQTSFNTANMIASVFSERLHNWFWTARAGFAYDTDRNNFAQATAWDILLWGRYQRCRNLGLHIGFLAQTGMRIDHFYPVIGFDWKATPRWKINAVFPVNISIAYEIDCNWTASIAGRVFNARHRLSRHDVIPWGLIVYRATGAEFRVTYRQNDRLSANIHAGGTFGGQLKVANQHYKNKQHFDFNPAPYVGGEIVFNF